MCGIAGFAGQGDRNDLGRMSDALAHRGPDGAGLHIDDSRRLFFAHRRLSIVDVGGGEQPMWNEDRKVCVIFNGEIYNHLELRRQLESLGHKFATDHSDTEVLVHGWEEWGHELPVKLNGMFAFAIFDYRTESIFLARDRFGEKPLYYLYRSGLFAFASELSALTCHSAIERRASLRAMQKLFAYGYIPAPLAFWEGCNKLPGGHWLHFRMKDHALRIEPYWQFRIEPETRFQNTDERALVEELAELLTQAGKRRLMSDVPLGLFLSGGVDSSVILASLAAKGTGQAFDTFTIGFNEPSYDESPFASAVAKHVGSNHHERILGINQAKDLIPKVLDHLDEPLGDPSILPTSMLSEFARTEVTVALSGDGGDELFAGYDPFLALKPAQLYDAVIPGWLHRGTVRLADLLPRSNANMSLDFKIRRSLMGMSYPPNCRLPAWMAPLNMDQLGALFESPVHPEDLYDEAIALWSRDKSLGPVDRTLEFFTRFYLQDNILTKVDRAAMMHSLETRAVFLDNDLVDFARRLPNQYKLRNGERKYLLKKVARRLLPSEIVDRKKKGFGIPLAQWLRDIPHKTSTKPDSRLSAEWAASAWREHHNGKADHRLFLWNWMSMQAKLTA